MRLSAMSILARSSSGTAASSPAPRGRASPDSHRRDRLHEKPRRIAGFFYCGDFPALRERDHASARSSGRSAGDGFLVAALDLVPVDDLVERADVVRAAVLVLQVIRVLPHVQAQDRGVA